jgi:protein-L-isoaspartate(D-aspartate) O-methyltransferase
LRGIEDERVLEAMSRVRREEFVPEEVRARAYQDCALPIGSGQTISQPFTVAVMLEALRLAGHERVLEVGTGSGYGAAVLSLLAREVFSIECVPELASAARDRLARLGYANAAVVEGDGSLGLPTEAPFGAIVVTAGAGSLPLCYLEQLAEGGRLVIPIGGEVRGQTLYCFTRLRGRLSVRELGPFLFVPLRGRYGVQTLGER